MSKSRIIFRVILLIALVLMIGWIAYLSLTQDTAIHAWRKAQETMQSEDYESARIHLLNLLEKEPDHGDGHYALAKAYIGQARKQGVQIGYGTHPDAYGHIVHAARLKPNDLEIQEQAMLAHLATENLRDAASLADAVIKHDPNNVDALYALTWRAVTNKQSGIAEQLFPKFEGLTNRKPFRTLGLMAAHYDQMDQAEQLQSVYARATLVAVQVDKELLASLSPREYDAMDRLLLGAVASALDVEVACDRFEAWFVANDKLIETESRKSSDLASPAAKFSSALESKIVDKPLDVAASNRIKTLSDRCFEIWNVAITDETTDLNVYNQAANLAFKRDDEGGGKTYLEKAIAAAAKIPADAQPENLDAQILELHLLAARKLVAQRQFAEAEKHIGPLLESKKGRGWGELLAGTVAMSQGRLDKAIQHYEFAQRELGKTLLVHIALANAYSSAQRWQDALEHLKALHVQFDRFTAEQRAWAEQYFGTESAVDFSELRAKLALGDWEGAQPHLRQLKATDLEPKAWLMAIAYLWINKKPQQAIALLNDTRRKFPDDLGLTRFQLFVYAQAKQVEEGTTFLERFVERAPAEHARQLLLCQWRMAQAMWPLAFDQLEKLLQNHTEPSPDRVALLALKAQVLLKLDRPEEALAIAEELRTDPKLAAAANIIGAMAELSKDNVEGAATAINAAADANPSSDVIGFLRGELAVAQGDYETAIEAFSKSLDVTRLQDRTRTAILQAVTRMASEKSPEDAEKKLAELLVKHPNDLGVLLAKANLDFSQGKLEQGMSYLDRISEIQPASASGPYLKAFAWSRVGQFDRALSELESGLKKEPHHAASLLLTSQVCLALQRNADALDYASQAIERSPQLWAAFVAKVQSLQNLARHEEAIKTLEEVIKSQPKLSEAYLLLAGIYVNRKDAVKALESYQRGWKERPEDLRIPIAMIALLVGGDQRAAAELVATQVVGENPDFKKQFALAEIYFNVGELPVAKRWADEAMKLAKDDQEKQSIHLTLGNIAMRQGQAAADRNVLETARVHYAKVLEIAPTHLTAGNNLAWLLATEFDQADEAVAICEKVRGKASVTQLPVRFVDTLATVYHKAGRLDDAKSLLTEAMDINPDHAQINFQLGLIMSDMNKPAESKNLLKRALELGLSDKQAAEAKNMLAKLEPSANSP